MFDFTILSFFLQIRIAPNKLISVLLGKGTPCGLMVIRTEKSNHLMSGCIPLAFMTNLDEIMSGRYYKVNGSQSRWDTLGCIATDATSAYDMTR